MSKRWKRTHKCHYCGKPFETTRYDAKYCPGGACRQAARRAGNSVTKNLPGVTEYAAPQKKAGQSAKAVERITLDLLRIRMQLKTADQEQADAINILLKGLKSEINDLLQMRDKDAQSRLSMVNLYAARRTQ